MVCAECIPSVGGHGKPGCVSWAGSCGGYGCIVTPVTVMVTLLLGVLDKVQILGLP